VKAAPRARSKNGAAFIAGRFDHSSNSKNPSVAYQKAIENVYTYWRILLEMVGMRYTSKWAFLGL
jgi:hypothetical protein